MTKVKNLFASVLLATVSAISFAKTTVLHKNRHALAPASLTAPTGTKATAKANRKKSTQPAKNNNKNRHAAKKPKKTQVSNAKGPGLEAY